MLPKIISASTTRSEIKLLLCCARTNPSDQFANTARILLKGDLDWGYLLRMAKRHRLTPLLYWHLNATCPEATPAPYFKSLQESFYRNVAHNLNLATELSKVLELCEARGVPIIPYKGPTLAISVYGNLALRQFDDLDFLIRKEDVAKVSEILSLHGYKKKYQLPHAQEAAFLEVECEHIFTSHGGRATLDVHWDIVRKYFSLRLDLDGFWQRLEPVSLGIGDVRSFAPEDLLLILCVNANKGFWERLVWICDVAELIRADPSLDWETVIRRASQMGTSRILYTTLLLAHDLLGARIPVDIIAKALADAKARVLALEIGQRLFENEDEVRLGPNFLSPARALERWRDRAKFYTRLALTPTIEDWTFVRLPRALSFVYYLTRPFRLAKKYIFGVK